MHFIKNKKVSFRDIFTTAGLCILFILVAAFFLRLPRQSGAKAGNFIRVHSCPFVVAAWPHYLFALTFPSGETI
jgi:hypothetical protein